MKLDPKILKYFLVALVVIIIDQASKMLVHNNMMMGTAGEIDVIGDWFKLHYLLNPGMAFGLKSSHEYGKLLLTLFRLVAMVGIGYYIYYLYKKQAHTGLLWCMGLILGGAVGNVIDSTFYGVLLDNAPAGSPTPWFHGQVIDMLFFPLFDGYYPEWIPGIGGDYFLFFSPVFNIADSSIFIGVVIILIFQKKFFVKEEDDKKSEETKEAVEESVLG
ncbi:lipoprotein signal peptidase [Fulvivirga lutea]|uniref:Lipoprotein signal peptidase n=1 Tax=Fulvivirga lutea TaxID=2810512 RepID=A0A974WLE9_9BACT|nr:lipoprotein signal peptidase [Fulvivirga lutea]QSE98375.1 lipoprotein signal peptidase [Fulvivirga lutea]